MKKIILSLSKFVYRILEAAGVDFHGIYQREIEKRKHKESELLEQIHFLQHILDMSTTRIWHFDKDIRVVTMNRAAQKNLEYPLEYYLGKTTFDYFHDMDDAQAYYEMDMEVIASGKPDIGRLDVYEAPDGQMFYKHVDRIPYYDEKGEIAGITVYSYDITEQKRAEIRLMEQRKLLEEEIRKRITVEQKLRLLATTDPLTGVLNRRRFFELAEKELSRAKRTDKVFSIILFDIDHFKEINDTFSHLAGDKVLQTIAKTCQDNLRDMDIFARYGGEEFIILLPEIETAEAQIVANKLRNIIAQQVIVHENQNISVTVSLGIASISSDFENIDQLLAKADIALYHAKDTGRNRVQITPLQN